MRYVFRRLFMLLFTMLTVSFFAFTAFSLISGSAATARLGTEATPERVAALEAELGLNRPLLIRYGEWLGGFFTGHPGTSLSYRQDVGELLRGKIAVTLCLNALSFALIILFSIPAGILSACFDNPLYEAVHTAFNQFCMSVPPFFTGILLSWVFGIMLKWFQPGAFPGLDHMAEAIRFLFLAGSCHSPRRNDGAYAPCGGAA